MQKYSETEFNSNESLVEYVYHIDDITLFGFKILSLPLKRIDRPTWFSNFNDRVGSYIRNMNGSTFISGITNNYNKTSNLYTLLSVGDYIIYDSRFDKVYVTDYDGILNLFNTITGYEFELLLDAAFESDSNGSDIVDNCLPVITTVEDTFNPSYYKFGDTESMPFIDAVTEFGEFQPVETPHVKDAIKYLIRYPRKNGLEDLKKAQWFINHLIEIREKIEASSKEKGV